MLVKFIERLHSLHDQHLLNLLEQKKAFTCKKRFQLLQDMFATPTRKPFHFIGTPRWPP